MPNVRIIPSHKNVTGQLLGNGTILIVDGKPLQDVTDISLHFNRDEVVRCDVSMLVKDQFEFVGDIDMHLHIHLPEGCKLVEAEGVKVGSIAHQVVRVIFPDEKLLDGPSTGPDVPGGGANP